MSITADLRQFVYALSDALDLVGIDDVAHGKRVGVMAAECAKTLGADDAQVRFLFDLGLLHDVGVSNTETHLHLVSEFDWTGSQTHCRVGYELLKDFAPLRDMALPVLYHHTRWDELQRLKVDDHTARAANLILLVDRVDATLAPYYASGQALRHSPDARAAIVRHSGRYFDPILVEAFLRASTHEAFWLNLEASALHNYLGDMARNALPCTLSHTELRQLARLFSQIVDTKCRFTQTHSLGVAQVARRLAERLGVAPERCEELEIAGLLHDIGKLRVPDHILEKPGPLDPDERLVMNTHSFETLQILKKIRGFEHITAWAADHHEAPGGHGYPHGLDADQLPLEARILRVADIFQAMVQDRPYRAGLDRDAVADFMRQRQAEGSVDATVTTTLLAHLDELYTAARQGETAATT
ncbi:HD-GYP domain-containing protein [Aquabacterium sp. A08]|uniref:HD-GYP domain-containing protein n=1 Tax=Aquabacterium sp. A08 TaxID=2718532 RepID=UPI00141EAE0F|nr:HD domain-containing phosphohydrolase [Aquabacterium sp. A08]NIC41209.1 HD domain-containing protein [Aquabacterium sp. A08]